MKKFLAFMYAITMSVVMATAAEQTQPNNIEFKPPCQHQITQDRVKKAAEFDKKLGLTEEQKVQARELRKQGFEKMKPVMDEIKAKRKEAVSVKKSNLAPKAQEEKLVQIDKDIKALEKQAHEIRKANMKEFESILTKEQQKTLKQMKKEGRDNFKKNHPKCRPPMPPKF